MPDTPPERPVERTIRRFRVLTPLLLLLAGGGLFWFAEQVDDPPSPVMTPTRGSGAAVAEAVPMDAFQDTVITEFAALVDGTPATLADRPVALEDIRVERPLGDSTFWITGDNRERFFVAAGTPAALDRLREEPALAETIDLRGTVRAIPAALDAWALTEADARLLQKRTLYLRAETVSP